MIETFNWNFDVLLTVHLSIFISVINQIYAQNFFFTKGFSSCLYMFWEYKYIEEDCLLNFKEEYTKDCML